MAVLARYRSDPSLTVRDLEARYGVSRTTISRWLREAGLSRPPGNRKGAAVGRRLVVEDDFKAVLLRVYGVEGQRGHLTASEVKSQGGAEPLRETFAVSSPSAQALLDRWVHLDWVEIALSLRIELTTGLTVGEWQAAFGQDFPTPLLRRAKSDAVDLKRKVKRRLDALDNLVVYQDAVREFRGNWLDAQWSKRLSRTAERERTRADRERAAGGRTETGLDNHTK
jgi:hypothetical protein